MKKQSRIENENKIVASVKREMDQPRLAESVRNGIGARTAPAAKRPATHSAGSSFSIRKVSISPNSKSLDCAHS
jgi:hypothetical protein